MLPLQPSDAFGNQVRPEHQDDPTRTCAHLHLPLQSPRHPTPSPPAPIPIPSPVPRVQAPSDLEANLDMSRDIEATAGVGDALRPGRLGFVGDLINGLRKLPRALTKSYHPNDPTVGHTNDPEFIASNGHDHEGRLSSSSTNHSVRLDHERAPSPSLRAIIDDSLRLEDDLRRRNDATHPNSNPANTIRSNSSQLTSPGAPTLIFSDPKPAPDHVQMGAGPESRPHPLAESNPTLISYFARLRRFVKAVNDLPWIAPRTTVDYIPGQSQSSDATKRSYHRRNTLSWYAAAPPPHHSLDLLSSGTASPEPMARSPDSTATLVSHANLSVHPFQPTPEYNPSLSNPSKPKSSRSHSVQFYIPNTRDQSTVDTSPFSVARPPPARTS